MRGAEGIALPERAESRRPLVVEPAGLEQEQRRRRFKIGHAGPGAIGAAREIVRARPDIGFGFGKAFEFKRTQRPAPDGAIGTLLRSRDGEQPVAIPRAATVAPRPPATATPLERFAIGRASGGERVCP